MKPSFTPWVFSKASLYWARSAMTALMSTSLKVVSMAALFWASFRRRAMVWRRRGRRSLGAGVEGGERVALGDPAVLAGAGNRARIELVLGDHSLGRGRQHRLGRRLGGRGSRRRRRCGRRSLHRFRSRLGAVGLGRSGGGRAFGDLA